MSQLLPNAHLLTVHGWGHTAQPLSICADAVTAAYLLDGALPPAGTVCEQDTPIFGATPAANRRAATPGRPGCADHPHREPTHRSSLDPRRSGTGQAGHPRLSRTSTHHRGLASFTRSCSPAHRLASVRRVSRFGSRLRESRRRISRQPSAPTDPVAGCGPSAASEGGANAAAEGHSSEVWCDPSPRGALRLFVVGASTVPSPGR